MTDPTVPETLITTYLEMTAPADFQPAYIQDPAMTILYMAQPDLHFYRFLYRVVGEVWRWRDRLLLSDEDLHAILAAPGTRVDVLYVQGVPAGYIELDHQGESVEIAYFGLRPDFFGRGLGKHLLSYAVARAWERNARRVWVHTCNLDGPHALANYQKRGFKIYGRIEEPMPARYQD